MTKKEILALSNDELRHAVEELLGFAIQTKEPFFFWTEDNYPSVIGAAWPLLESVYGHGGKIKDGAWVLGTVHNARDCAHACLMWKEQGFTKFRPLKVEVDCPRGEMARAITLCWVCAMLGASDV